MDSERFSVLDGLFSEPAATPEAAPGAAGDAAPEAVLPGEADPEADGSEAGGPPANAPEPAGFANIPAPATGDRRVDETVAGLAALGDRPLEEHPPVFETVHDTLRGLLGELGEPGRPGRPGQQGELGGDR
ncbi:MAG: hypothetical protein FWE35_03965 [Streptosporangiales bacterium]|nr:hypothetical protein [Streptosporangiales bacterium]